MNRTVLTLCVAAVAMMLPVAGGAQTKPDFSGTWELDAKRSDSAHSTATSQPVRLVIKQSDTDVSIETRQGESTETLLYRLDGSETERPAADNGPFNWRAQWDGNKLMTETHRNINRSTVTVKEVRTLDPKAGEMIVERTLVVQHGYQMRGAKNYSSGKDVFVKAR